MLWLIAAASGLVAPDITRILSPQDYPAEAMAHDWSAAAIVDILLDPRGKIVRCTVGSTVGVKQLATKICDLVHHKRVRAAQGADGTPLYGVAHGLIKMWIPDTSEGRAIAALKDPPDVELSVNKLPNGAAEAETDVSLLVDSTERVADCAFKSADPIGAIACSARDQLDVGKVADPDGKPVSYVTKVKVRITTAVSSSSS